MNPDTNIKPARRPNGGRIAAIVVAALVGAISLGFLTVGGVLLWADSKKDESGYLSTSTERFDTKTSALVSENLDVDLDGVETVLDDDTFGKVRVAAESKDGKPVFVGVARTSDVEHYLSGTAYDVVTDVDYSPFDPDYSLQPGTGRADAPGTQRFWEAAVEGKDRQQLDWNVESGDWSVVVMNADGSPGVAADVKAGAELAWLDEAAWISLGTGLALLALAGGLLYVGVRPRREPPLGSAEQAFVTVA